MNPVTLPLSVSMSTTLMLPYATAVSVVDFTGPSSSQQQCNVRLGI